MAMFDNIIDIFWYKKKSEKCKNDYYYATWWKCTKSRAFLFDSSKEKKKIKKNCAHLMHKKYSNSYYSI